MVERICSGCKGSNLKRSSRKGFKEKFVYAMFGLYPWRCRACHMRTMLRDRGGDSRNSGPAVHANS